MDFINQVKKLKEVTKSPEVRTLCESFLNGGSVSESDLVKSINEHNITPDFVSNTQSHLDMIRKEEAELSKKNAAALMESWGGLKNASLNNAGSFKSCIFLNLFGEYRSSLSISENTHTTLLNKPVSAVCLRTINL